MKTTMTLGEIRAAGPCAGGWRKLLSGLWTDDPATVVDLRDILRINGSRDAWWATRCLPKRERVALGVLAARTVAHLHPQAAATLDVCDRWLARSATDDDLARAAAAMAAAAMAARDAVAVAAMAAAMAARDAAAAAAMAAGDAALESSWSSLGDLMRQWCEEQEVAR